MTRIGLLVGLVMTPKPDVMPESAALTQVSSIVSGDFERLSPLLQVLPFAPDVHTYARPDASRVSPDIMQLLPGFGAEAACAGETVPASPRPATKPTARNERIRMEDLSIIE